MRVFSGSTLLVLLVITSQVWANDGSINFTGELIDTACKVDVGASSPLSVDLGKVQKTAFTGEGSTASATKFTLKLSACPETMTRATVKFQGTSFGGDESALALTADTGVAEGIAVQLLDSSSQVVSLESDSSPYNLAKDTVNDLDFYARFIQKGGSVVPGKANATASFTIAYQ